MTVNYAEGGKGRYLERLSTMQKERGCRGMIVNYAEEGRGGT